MNGHCRPPRALRKAALSFMLALVMAQAHAVTGAGNYPRIPALISTDPVFKQFSDDVLDARMALAAGKKDKPLPLHLYSYTVRKGETLIGIAARCSIPYDAIASLNRIASIQESLTGRTLVLPTLPGLYLAETASNTFENLLLSSFDPDNPAIISFQLRESSPVAGDDRRRTVHCIPDTLFEGTVRTFFLTPTFRFPLPAGILTSSFGMRKNPVTGNLVFHKGVDIAAPWGTPVLACADGEVTEIGSDVVYGNYLILRHDGSRESLYGHLQSIKIELHEKIKSGSIIGTVGSTGQSTGPHLHFELHENGIPKNPTGFIKGK